MTMLRAILGFLPWERIVAYVLSKLLKKFNKAKKTENLAKMAKLVDVADRIHESAAVAHSLLADQAKHVALLREVTADNEITTAEAAAVGEAAIKAWARAKETPDDFKDIWRPVEVTTVTPSGVEL